MDIEKILTAIGAFGVGFLVGRMTMNNEPPKENTQWTEVMKKGMDMIPVDRSLEGIVSMLDMASEQLGINPGTSNSSQSEEQEEVDSGSSSQSSKEAKES